MQKQKELYIVIADDDPDDIDLIEPAFEAHPAFKKISCYSNGIELQENVSAGDQKPDIILTDINMPLMGGLDALENLQQLKIPTIVFSTIANPAHEKRYLELGVIGFLKKPIDYKGYSELPKKVLEILEKV